MWIERNVRIVRRRSYLLSLILILSLIHWVPIRETFHMSLGWSCLFDQWLIGGGGGVQETRFENNHYIRCSGRWHSLIQSAHAFLFWHKLYISNCTCCCCFLSSASVSHGASLLLKWPIVIWKTNPKMHYAIIQWQKKMVWLVGSPGEKLQCRRALQKIFFDFRTRWDKNKNHDNNEIIWICI